MAEKFTSHVILHAKVFVRRNLDAQDLAKTVINSRALRSLASSQAGDVAEAVVCSTRFPPKRWHSQKYHARRVITPGARTCWICSAYRPCRGDADSGGPITQELEVVFEDAKTVCVHVASVGWQ